MTRIRLCAESDVPVDAILRVSRGRHPALAVINLDGEFFALDDRCTHGNASMSAGEVEDGLIFCPLHFGSFDIRTGEPADPPCDAALRTYPVTVVDGEVFCEVEE